MLRNGLKNNFHLGSAEETFHFGYKLGKEAPKNTIFSLFGPMGAGKTTLVKGIASGAIDYDAKHVTSPTFSYLNIYQSPKARLFHFDLYRLKDEKEFLDFGFEEYLFQEEVTCIEWSERIASLLSSLNAVILSLKIITETTRLIEVTHGPD